MGYIDLFLMGGVLIVVVLGLYVEFLLCEYCMIFMDNIDFCFIRI